MTSNTVQQLLIAVARSLGLPAPGRAVITRYTQALEDIDDSALDYLVSLIAKRHMGNSMPKPARVLQWFNQERPGGKAAQGPKGCHLCEDGTPGQLSVVLAHHRGDKWPWHDALEAIRAEHRKEGWSAGWSVASYQMECDCAKEGAPKRLLDAWMQPDKLEVLDALIAAERVPAQWAPLRESTLALAKKLGAGVQVRMYG